MKCRRLGILTLTGAQFNFVTFLNYLELETVFNINIFFNFQNSFGHFVNLGESSTNIKAEKAG